MQSALNAPHFADENAAFAYVEAWLWPNGPVCPHCGTVGEATRSKGKTTRPGLWNCRPCRKPFTVRMGTMFESSHVPMRIWFQAIYLICSVFLDHNTVRAALWRHLDMDSRLYTDGSPAYRNMTREHSSADHSKEEWVRGDVHTNTLEGLLKRDLIGVYQHVEEQHLDR